MNCPDCGVEKGSYHKRGCDHEICPKCKSQVICCDCGETKVRLPYGFEPGNESDLWLEFLDEKTKMHCALCGNSGIIDTREKGLKTAMGLPVGVRNFCICPNGRVMKAKGCKI